MSTWQPVLEPGQKALDVTIFATARIGHTVSGNPRWALNTDRGRFVTEPDASCNFSISGYWEDRPARIWLNRQGRIFWLDADKEQAR